jgi:hypothetical protein
MIQYVWAHGVARLDASCEPNERNLVLLVQYFA